MNSNQILFRKSSPSDNDHHSHSNKMRAGTYNNQRFQVHQLPMKKTRSRKKKQCWVASILYILIGSIIFILIVMNNNKNYIATKQNMRSKINNGNNTQGDCQALNILPPNRIATLERLNLNNCGIDHIPITIKYAKNLKQLDVGNNPKLASLPDELEECSKLEILFVSNCRGITSLPSVLGKMTSITRLGWRSGSLTTIDPNGIPPNLIHLILTDNNIQSIEEDALFDKLQHVRKLMLSHNNIKRFGSDNKGSIKKLKSLELLRLAGNQLSSIPNDLWTLPNLTWLTISGNPFMDNVERSLKVPWIGVQDLEPTGNFLGEGASGKVTSYLLNNQAVAVKTIHGVTSDGRAEDELKVYGAVGSDGIDHKVVGCVALLDDEEKKGAVMQQLPSNLHDLALPPTIIEVTKDRWDNWSDDYTFNISFVMNVLIDIAGALRFLHDEIGVAHGDVYAHNMKVDKDTGHVFLLDFGASYFTDAYKKEAERLEVRAFGVLILELVSKLDPSVVQVTKKLKALASRCVDEDIVKRPTFRDIEGDIRVIENTISSI